MRDNPRLPNPWAVPVVSVPIAGLLLGMSKTRAYVAATRGDIPTITLAGVKVVPVADLYGLLGLPLPARPSPPPIVDR